MTDRQLLAILTAILYMPACRWAENSTQTGLDCAVEWARDVMERTGTTSESLAELPK